MVDDKPKKLTPPEARDRLNALLGDPVSVDTLADDALARDLRDLKEPIKDYTQPATRK